MTEAAKSKPFMVQPVWCGATYMVCNQVMGRIEYRPLPTTDHFRAFSLADSNQPRWIEDYETPAEARAAVETAVRERYEVKA